MRNKTRLFNLLIVIGVSAALLLGPVAAFAADAPGEATPSPETTATAPEPTPSQAPPVMRPFPRWVEESGGLPVWMYSIDEFPSWFFDLKEEPVWFRELDRVPAWFYTITEIPAWFYPQEDAESTEDEESEERSFPEWVAESGGLPMWMYSISEFPDWFYDLTEEPVWYRELDSAPAWFYSISEIPDWFYPGESAEPDVDSESDDGQETEADTEPAGPSDDETVSASDLPEIDTEVLPYRRDLGNGLAVFSDIPNGMVTNDEVYISFPQEMLLLMRGDSLCIYEPGAPLTEHGIYTLSSIESPLDIVFSFRIITHPVNDMAVFTVPDGFRLVEAYFGDEPQDVSGNSFNINEDGEYSFVMSDGGVESPMTVKVTVDTGAPTLIFTKQAEGADTPEDLTISPEGGDEFLAPIDFYVADGEECQVVVLLNSTNIRLQENRLTEPGLYRITATDAAGNSSFYTFRILYVMNVPTVWVIVIASLMVITLAAYLIRNRVKMRVR